MSQSEDFFITLKNVFIGRTYSTDIEMMEDGGERCYNQLSNSFRFSVYFGMVIKTQFFFHLLLYLLKTKSHIKKLKSSSLPPSTLEKIFGWLQILIFLCQVVGKGLTQRLLFCFNHCHLCTLLQGYLLLSRSTPKNTLVFANTIVWSTGA
jgi:hypothetical protein